MTLINQKKNHTLNASDREQVSRLVKLSKGNYDVHFMFFKNGKTWIAVADDADRLFEVFGWQTSIVYDAMNCPVSWMVITFYGMEVIKHSKYSYQVLEHVDIDIATVSFVEQQVSSVQQYVDFNRLLVATFGETKDKLPVRKKIISHTTEVDKMLYVDCFVFSGDKVYSCIEDDQRILVADGKNWLLNDIGLPLILTLESLACGAAKLHIQ